jgi:hypothetical protein
MPVFLLGCAVGATLFGQTEKDPDSVSYRERELKACGAKEKNVKYVADTDKTKHPTGTTPADQSLIYVLRPSGWGNRAQTKLAVDGEWKGVNRANNYFFFTVQPGIHYFCSESVNRSIVVLTAEAGKTYYLEQQVHPGAMMKVRTQLGVMEETEGPKALARTYPSTWEPAPGTGGPVAAGAVQAPEAIDQQAKAWLDANKEPAAINVTGIWLGAEWGRVPLTQREGGRRIIGSGDGWDISGVVSGSTVYLLFSDKGKVAFSARLTAEGNSVLNGTYTTGLLSSGSRTRAIRLTK